MPEFMVTSPDGVRYRVTAPEGATADEALARVQAQHEAKPSAPSGIAENFMAPIRAIPGDIGAEFESGAEHVRSGVERGGFLGAAEQTVGAVQEAASPLTGTTKALVGDPIKKNIPGKTGEFVGNLAEDAAGMVGPGAASKGLGAAAKMLSGRSAAVKLLMDEGVNLTPGHMGGKAVKSGEDALTSVPVAGSFVKTAQGRMVSDFNKAVINRSLGEIGEKLPKNIEAGRDAIAYAERRIGSKYDELLPKLTLSADVELGEQIKSITGEATTMPPDQAAQLRNIIQDKVAGRMTEAGTMTGRTFKQADSDLSRLARTYSRSPNPGERELAQRVNDVRAALRENLERSNPEHAGELQTLNSAWAAFARAQGASTRRATSGGLFTAGDLLGDIKSNSTRGVFARGDGLLQDLAEAGQQVLPSSLPNSGTVDRATWVGLLGLAGSGQAGPYAAEAALAGGAATLPYTKAGMAATNAAVRGAPELGRAATRALSGTGPVAAGAQAAGQDEDVAPDAAAALAGP